MYNSEILFKILIQIKLSELDKLNKENYVEVFKK